MHQSHHHDDEYDDLEPEEIEAYCVRCKQSTVIENPKPVWTKRGAPGTRGECEMCGTTVFRMGRTDAHRGMVQPDVSQFSEISGRGRRHSSYATFINYVSQDSKIAEQIAHDLNRTGIPTWAETGQMPNTVEWASGVHPALEECEQMVLILSSDALQNEAIEKNWQFFREQRKPITIAQVETCEVPDAIRRRPRFDFSVDYKSAFRQLVQTLSGG